MVGERWGRLRASSGKRFRYGLGRKSLEGNFACLAACLVVGIALAVVTHLALWVVVLGAIFATVMESLALPVNDNLSIPLVAAGVMSLVYAVMV
jgi:dolichol kinase